MLCSFSVCFQTIPLMVHGESELRISKWFSSAAIISYIPVYYNYMTINLVK
jgi:hypothetical protein